MTWPAVPPSQSMEERDADSEAFHAADTQLLALHFGAGASTRAIGRELGIAPSTVRG
jgi:DNA-binding CsgD family transcriptional regulator